MKKKLKQLNFLTTFTFDDIKAFRPEKGRHSPIRGTRPMQELIRWLDTKPGRNEYRGITDDTPGLDTASVKHPILAFFRTTRKILKDEYPEYMVFKRGPAIIVCRKDSQI